MMGPTRTPGYVEFRGSPDGRLGGMDGFLQILSPGAFVGGLGLLGRSPRCFVSPSRRSFFFNCSPVPRHLAVYLSYNALWASLHVGTAGA